MKLIFTVSLSFLFLSGCAGSSQSTKRGWNDSNARVTGCKAYCLTWSSDGDTCIEFHEKTSERCLDELLDDN